MIRVEGRIIEMSERRIEVEYRTFNGRVRRIRIIAPRAFRDSFLFEDEIKIEMEEER